MEYENTNLTMTQRSRTCSQVAPLPLTKPTTIMETIGTLGEHPATRTLNFCRSMSAKYREMLLTADAEDSLQPPARTNQGKPLANRHERMKPCKEAFERGDCAVDIAAENGVHPQTLIRYAWTHGWDSPLFDKGSRPLTLANQLTRLSIWVSRTIR